MRLHGRVKCTKILVCVAPPGFVKLGCQFTDQCFGGDVEYVSVKCTSVFILPVIGEYVT